jgi:hypothetical protein
MALGIENPVSKLIESMHSLWWLWVIVSESRHEDERSEMTSRRGKEAPL